MTQPSDEQAERFRIGDKGIEAVPKGAAAKAGFADKKKVLILAVLLVAGGGVAAYQFLGGSGPKQAVAVSVPSPVATSAPAGATNVESVLARLEAGPQTRGEDTLSVDRVEKIVNTFDTYVQMRQVPLSGLRVNPFTVVQDKPEQKVLEDAQADEEAKAEARRNQVLQAARALKVGSILIVGNEPKAIVGGKLYRVGDTVQGLCVDAIASDCVTLSFEGETVRLRLRPETNGG
ncbi:MAG TPA: hypothetical protein VM238_20235 [Phycisphaerae bacterium]|nr:hypothetical protein [Phycisphaerae bacterium]